MSAQPPALAASTAILTLAAWLVPRPKRAEWLAEWRAELWHVRRVCHPGRRSSLRDQSRVIAFCLGAFKDALWMRQNGPQTDPCRICDLGSPLPCILSLAALAAVAWLLAFYLPGVRKVLSPAPYRESDELVTISPSGSSAAPLPSVRLADYQDWSHSARHLFTEIAFYQALRRRVPLGNHATAELSVARASDNLFQLLDIPVSPGPATAFDSGHPARVVLSRAAWRKYFHGDPRIFGQLLEVDGKHAVISGEISEEDWRLSGRVDLWLLESEPQLAALPAHTQGYVLARIAPAAFPSDSDGRRRMSVFRGDRDYDRFDCISLAEQTRQPLSIFLFTLLLACLALPATTSLPLGEYPAHQGRLSWPTRFRRWAFLGVKLAWIVVIVYCGSLDLAYSRASIGIAGSQYLQLIGSFSAFLFAFRWALRDQRKRCPVCLRSLTNPARVGQSSRNFLAWNGTELVCLGGHGLLHVPDIPTSWFSTQRWLYLDPSWSGLFSSGYLVSAGIS